MEAVGSTGELGDDGADGELIGSRMVSIGVARPSFDFWKSGIAPDTVLLRLPRSRRPPLLP